MRTRLGFQVRGVCSGTNSEYLKTQCNPHCRPLNDFSKSISVLARSISVLVMNEWITKPIA